MPLKKLDKFHPPAFLNDFEDDQLDRWLKTVNGWFSDEIVGFPLNPTDDVRWAYAEDLVNQRAPPRRGVDPLILKFHEKNPHIGEDKVVEIA
ncbi:hypothetical protein LY78DRAFT_707774 [Colletotrichum sublineola]|nr:hypothetical protein LY78DRAFT_707774 [Colletotrichum sublineola]